MSGHWAYPIGRVTARLKKPRVVPPYFLAEAAAAFLAGYDAETETAA